MAMPTSAGDQEGQRDGDDQAGAEQAGRVGADDLLHDEGGVGAEHHHLAVRHVDHAHHAEGDGQPGGGEQQHRAEREAVIDALRQAPELLRAVDGGNGGGGRTATGGGSLPSEASSERASMSPRARSVLIAASWSASLLSGDESTAAARACSMRDACRRVLFLRQRAVERRQSAGSCEVNTASAALMRAAESGENRCRMPSAASIARRTALFTRTLRGRPR